MEAVLNSPRMKLALIADTFPPFRTSGAVQLRDLSREFVRQGHELTVLLPSADLEKRWELTEMDGVRILRLRAPRTKDIGYMRRTINEFLMPFAMQRSLRQSPLSHEKWEGVIWYAPSIFHGPLALSLKRKNNCKGYLIIRDIFPEWAADMGLMSRGLPYLFFKAISKFQYAVANIIGVQTPGNRRYFENWAQKGGRKLEVLNNWLDRPADTRCSIRLETTILANCKVFVYAGNMGIAQGMDIVLELADKLKERVDVGFLFVGRGSEAKRLKELAGRRGLSKVLFFDEIDPDEIPDLYAQCSIGIVALDPRHKSHNIPGKFLTYMQSGLPVLANVNAGNDLAKLIRDEQVGYVCESNELEELSGFASILLEQIEVDTGLPGRCRKVFERDFSVKQVAQQIVTSLHT